MRFSIAHLTIVATISAIVGAVFAFSVMPLLPGAEVNRTMTPVEQKWKIEECQRLGLGYGFNGLLTGNVRVWCQPLGVSALTGR